MGLRANTGECRSVCSILSEPGSISFAFSGAPGECLLVVIRVFDVYLTGIDADNRSYMDFVLILVDNGCDITDHILGATVQSPRYTCPA